MPAARARQFLRVAGGVAGLPDFIVG